MCGIAGIILQPNIELPDLSERLDRMAQRMVYRGPDDREAFSVAAGRWEQHECGVRYLTRHPAPRHPFPTSFVLCIQLLNPSFVTCHNLNGLLYCP